MNLPIEDLTPREIVAELDKYIVGQDAAKRAIAVAMRNRYRRQTLPREEREDILPKNILMIGPTGVGKTEIARRLAQLARAPFIKIEATKFTEVGYVGRDVESMIRDLAAAAVRLVEAEKVEAMRPEAEKRAMDRIVDLLDDEPDEWPGAHRQAFFGGFGEPPASEEPEADFEEVQHRRQERRDAIRAAVVAGERDAELIEIDVDEPKNPFLQVFTPGGMEEMGIDGNNMGGMFGTQRTTRRITVAEGREVLQEEEARKMLDRPGLHREAIERAEQTGIVFLDEIDKVAGKSGGSGPDVSREGVQRDLLPVIEGSTVHTKFGPLRTDHILFVAAGAFHISKPSDLIPELQGRLPIRVELESLSQQDFRKILVEPKNALVRQYQLLLGADGVKLQIEPDAIDEIAAVAAAINEKLENIGARRLHTVLERLLEKALFQAPDPELTEVVLDRAKVRTEMEPFLRNLDAARRVL